MEGESRAVHCLISLVPPMCLQHVCVVHFIPYIHVCVHARVCVCVCWEGGEWHCLIGLTPPVSVDACSVGVVVL